MFEVFMRGELPRRVPVQQRLDTSLAQDVGSTVLGAPGPISFDAGGMLMVGDREVAR